MQTPVQIVYRNLEHSEALEAHVHLKASKLEEIYDRISNCHVTIEVPHRHHQQGKRFNVRVDVKVPGGEVIASREQSEDPYVALRETFDHARRQLEEYVSRLRGDVKHHEPTWRQKIKSDNSSGE